MSNYYLILRTIHVLMMATWFGAALSVSLIWARRKNGEPDTVREYLSGIIGRLEGIAAIILPLTGVLMLLRNTVLLQAGWLRVNIVLGVVAITLSRVSLSKLKKIQAGQEARERSFELVRSGMFFSLIVIIVLAQFKPF